MNKFFRNRYLPLWLSAPQLLIMFMFFYLPIFMAFYWSFHLERPFGGGSEFVGWQNYTRTFGDPEFWQSLWRTMLYTVLATVLSISAALIIALACDRAVRLTPLARNVMMWPKGIAAASVGVVFVFLFNPYQGVLSWVNDLVPDLWNPRTDALDTWIMLLITNTWNALTFSFIILLAGLQSIPDTLHKAAAIDGAGPWRRLWDIQLPLLTPQLFIVSVLEVADSLAGSFALVATMTEGGPGDATNFLVYKIYRDGFAGYDLSGAATQTALLMIVVVAVTSFQYLFIERKVEYQR
ncbi:MAG: sugar ABC transporter permease [Pseudomonadota bacterium]